MIAKENRNYIILHIQTCIPFRVTRVSVKHEHSFSKHATKAVGVKPPDGPANSKESNIV
jgi:hypothetical protein